MTRRTLAALALALAAAVALPGAADAQCATGCTSSTSCGGTGKGYCFSTCDSKGNCSCGDSSCKTAPLPPAAFSTAPGPFRLAGFAPASTPLAVLWADCRGNVVDVRFTDILGRDTWPALDEIPLRDPDAGRASVASS